MVDCESGMDGREVLVHVHRRVGALEVMWRMLENVESFCGVNENCWCSQKSFPTKLKKRVIKYSTLQYSLVQS